MSVEENKATLQRGAEAFNNAKDRSGWFSIHDPSVRAHGLAPEPLDMEGLKAFYAGLWAGFPDLTIAPEDLIAEGEKVVLRLTARGTHQGEFRGIPPTGREVKFGAQYIFEFRNGKIIKRWTNFDRLGVLMQIGAVPAMA